jgi:hypothetical protein
MTGTVITIWALAWLVIVATLAAAARRIGTARAAAWLIAIGLFLLVIEEPALTVWLAMTGPRSDRDGMATLITPMAQAHVLDAGMVAVAVTIGLGYVTFTGVRRARRSSWRVLAWGFAVALVAEVITTTLVFSRGLPLPGVAGRDAFGWQPVAVGLLAWALGLALGRPSRAPAHVAVPPTVAPVR